MQGQYRGAEFRAAVKQQWIDLVIPDLIKNETTPLRDLLPVQTDIVAIDIGANKGFWAAALLRVFPGAVKHVYLIDPSPENYRELSNWQDNMIFSPEELALTSAYPYAMSSKEGFISLFTNEDGSPLASVYQNATRGFQNSPDYVPLSREIKIPTDTVDAFMQRHDLDHVHILKADVEGHEMPVFEGAREALANKKIDLIFFEFGIHQIHSRNYFVDFYDMFDGYGYTMFTAHGGMLRKIEMYTYEFENLSTLHHMFAVRRQPDVAEVSSSTEAVTSSGAGLLNRLTERLRGPGAKPG